MNANEEVGELKYWTNNGVRKNNGGYDNYITSIKGKVTFVKSHMGGNYGPNDEYLVENETGTYKVLYYGDQSAQVTKL
jgi:hypothetical protein